MGDYAAAFKAYEDAENTPEGPVDENFPFLRKFMSGVTANFSEMALEALGADPPADTGTLGTAFELGGGLIGMGKLLGAGRQAATRLPGLANTLSKYPRLTNLGLSTAESAVGGGLNAAGKGEDITTGAGESALFGAGLTGFAQGVGGVGKSIINRGLPGTPFQGVKPRGSAHFDDPFSPPANIEDDRMNQGLIDWLTEEGIEVVPLVVRHQDPTVRYVTLKAAQMTSSIPYMQAKAVRINDQFRKAMDRIPSGMGPKMSVGTNMDYGEHTKSHFSGYIGDLRQSAVTQYDQLFSLGNLGQQTINSKSLAAQLRTFLADEGFADAAVPGGVAKVKRFISRLDKGVSRPGPLVASPKGGAPLRGEGTEGKKVDYNEAWKTIQRWWPKGSQWDDSDFIAVKAQGIVKDHLKSVATNANPRYATALQSADMYWKQMNDVLDSSIGKTILRKHPERLIEDLTADITTIREVREVFGDEMVTRLAQRKIWNLINSAADPESGSVTGKSFAAALKRAGKHDGMIGGGYWNELLKSHPGVSQKLHDMQRALSLYEGPLGSYKGMQEMMGGGQERQTLTTMGKSPSAVLQLLMHFSLGKSLGKAIAQPPSANPLLGGNTPYLPGLATRAVEKVRRAEAATGAIQGIKGQSQEPDR